MRDMFPEKDDKNEYEIVNLGSFDTDGIHWVCYYKSNKIKYFFDSYRKIIDKPLK